MVSRILRSHMDHPHLLAALFACWLIQPCLPDTGHAQATPPITASGLNTTVTKIGTTFDITGGTRPGNGPNLFHSFGEFGVPTSNIANFRNETALPTSNILGRVTGGNPSNIFGTIQTTGFGGANLFLMNPAGIIFGPSASLNVGGSVSFTTANYLRLADGARFNALPGPYDMAISSAPVAAFGFLGSTPGAITVQGGQLAVSEGNGIALVGGNIQITNGVLPTGSTQSARLSAPGGQINLVAAGSAGEVLTSSPTGQPTNPAVTGFSSFGNISLSQGTSLDTSADKAGRIVIRGGQFTMDDASLKAIAVNGQGGINDTANASPTISITAETIALNNGTLITADTHGTAPAGDITFNVNTLTTQAGTNIVPLNPPNDIFTVNGNLISSDSRSVEAGAGAAGKITIQGVGGSGTAATSVTLKDISLSTRIFGGTADTPPSAITITSESILFTNEVLPNEKGQGAATIVASTIGPAPAGNIALNANTLFVNVKPDETPIDGSRRVYINTTNDVGSTAGPAGIMTISGLRPETTDAARLVALYNAQLSSGLDGGTATTPPGAIIITADTLSLSGGTGIFASAFGDAAAPAGNIAFNVNTLRGNVKPDGTLINGQPNSFIFSSSDIGQAGTLTISGIGPEPSDAAQQVTLNNMQFNTVVTGGTAATIPAAITMTANTLRLTNGTNIETDTSGAAPAGHITIKTNNFLADQATAISSRTSATGPGGNISLTAGQSVSLSSGAMISASSTGPANAGNITINAGSQFLSQNASVTTEATHASGGNILIQATDLVRLVNSQINTSVQGGPTTAGGNITIDPAIMTLQNSQILAQAVQGQGGNISIIAGTFLADQTSVVSASSQFGLSGSVNIQSPVSGLSGTLATLPQRPLQAQNLLRQRCAAQANGQMSSFVVAGREALPTEPGGWLLSPPDFMAEAAAARETQAAASHDSPHQWQPLLEPVHEQVDLRNQSRFTGWTAGCRS